MQKDFESMQRSWEETQGAINIWHQENYETLCISDVSTGHTVLLKSVVGRDPANFDTISSPTRTVSSIMVICQSIAGGNYRQDALEIGHNPSPKAGGPSFRQSPRARSRSLPGAGVFSSVPHLSAEGNFEATQSTLTSPAKAQATSAVPDAPKAKSTTPSFPLQNSIFPPKY